MREGAPRSHRSGQGRGDGGQPRGRTAGGLGSPSGVTFLPKAHSPPQSSSSRAWRGRECGVRRAEGRGGRKIRFVPLGAGDPSGEGFGGVRGGLCDPKCCLPRRAHCLKRIPGDKCRARGRLSSARGASDRAPIPARWRALFLFLFYLFFSER